MSPEQEVPVPTAVKNDQTNRPVWSKPTITTADVSTVTKNGSNIARIDPNDGVNHLYAS